MSNPSARHQLVCGIAQRYPQAVVALAEAVGVPLPEHDDVQAAPDARQMRDGNVVYTDATVRLLREGRPVFFATVEMQREFRRGKYLTLHAYHGSGVRDTDAGGHLFVLSDQASETARFREEDARRRAELAFAASFHSGWDLRTLEKESLPLGARALPAALGDFAGDAPRTREMLGELYGSDLTLADLYLKAIVEEVPKTMLGEIVQPDMLDKLRSLEWFREYEAEVKAEAKADADAKAKVAAINANADADARVAAIAAKADARVAAIDAKADARVAAIDAKADARVAAAEAKAAAAEAIAAVASVAAVADKLTEFLTLRGDAPTEQALQTIDACRSPVILSAWLRRAYMGETSAQIFPEPEPRTS